MRQCDVKTDALLKDIRACNLCDGLPMGPNPIVQFNQSSRLLIVGQAPGRITHAKGVPFDDPSGDRLRTWLGVDRSTFYDASKIAIVPMGFCFPGSGSGGDIAPRAECAPAWRSQIMAHLSSVELTLVIGRYAIDWHLPAYSKLSVTKAVQDWSSVWPSQMILPHPSPRNNRWLKQNPWFEEQVLPALQARVKDVL